MLLEMYKVMRHCSKTVFIYVTIIQKTPKKVQPITSQLITLSTNHMRAFIRVAGDPDTGFNYNVEDKLAPIIVPGGGGGLGRNRAAKVIT